ncbi:striatin-interacting protein 1 homolog [Caerostris darwini]|uniref:Striatin-interacting protein 1 homolog n=1 Tax=Caerostris darwini TaxID=1538125 RepID=A0AAV4TPV5_9ARAC|nr:striatin-interacting protein 1 homolog [Caerostris darwini]
MNLSSESSDLDFQYNDADEHVNEMAELYSYTEEADFFVHKKAFEDLMEEYGLPVRWTSMTNDQKEKAILRILDSIEMLQRPTRMQAARAVLYLVQGVFGECLVLETQAELARANVFLLYKFGFFHTFVQLLNMEIENSSAATSALRKPAVSLGDSIDIRIILNVLYTFVEVMRVDVETDTDEIKQCREIFHKEIALPLLGEDLLAHVLFQMVTRFCSGSAPHFPIKKILLLLWKTILVSLGGTDELRKLKAKYRDEADLPPVPDDTIEVTKTMRAASPPASAADLIESQQSRKNYRQFRRQSLVKQNSMDEAYEDLDGDSMSGPDDELRYIEEHQSQTVGEDEYTRPPTPRPSTPLPTSASDQKNAASKGLPWVPKVRTKDIISFLDHTRIKFVGFQLNNDQTSLAGLPLPIHEGLKVLKQHMYVSLAEVQIKKEEEISKLPLSKKELCIPETSVEILYRAILPSLPQYMIALLKILLAAAPTSKAKTESINIMADVLPEEMPMTVIQSLKLGIDVNRHKEIIVKAISGIILLLLKHLKINHVYQFEYMSQQLMFANCIPLVLKFFNQNIMSYVGARNTISVIDFPACVIGETPEVTEETIEMGDQQPYCWRNLFTCINLLRLLNKLTKLKHSRIMMLVVFKSAPILKRALKVKHGMMQLYVLKLLKMQMRYLGRQWRKSNIKTVSAIYHCVRHMLNDDWAYGNDLDARPWDFQAEEFALQASINRFHNRRYDRSGSMCNDPEYQPVDNNVLSVLGREIELTDDFKFHYESWLGREVFQLSTDWDQLLNVKYLYI